MTNALHNTLSVTKVLLARLRFLSVFVVAALVVGYWDTIQNYVDKWTRPNAAQVADSDHYYTCSMHPSVRRQEPGKCPQCGMELQKKKRGEKVELPPGVLARVQLTPYRISLANIATTPLEEKDLVRDIRAVATLDYDETRIAQLAARVAGRVDELYVKSVGQTVRKGDPVYSLYSPELYTAMREYFSARKRVNELPADAGDDLRHDAIELFNASTQKLSLWGATSADFKRLDDAFDANRPVPTHFVVTSPISGIVARKNIFEGGYVSAGESPFTIVDLSSLWLQVRIYEQDVPLITLGERVEIHVEGQPDPFVGKITFLAYQLDPATRTLAARVEVANPDAKLKPGMYADALIRVPVIDSTPQKGPTPEEQTAAVRFAAAYRAALEPYFTIQHALADDKTDGIEAALKDILAKTDALKPLDDATEHVANLAKIIPAIKITPDLKKLRDDFADVSVEMIALGKHVGVPVDSAPVRIMHCPMGSRYDWLQTGAGTLNPYMGKRMLDCGNAVEALAKVAPVPATRPQRTGSRMLAVPRSAVIDTGSKKLVYVADAIAQGVFNLREVKVGPLAITPPKDNKPSAEFYPILSGLLPTDQVVTTGAFLLDSENRLTAESN